MFFEYLKPGPTARSRFYMHGTNEKEWVYEDVLVKIEGEPAEEAKQKCYDA